MKMHSTTVKFLTPEEVSELYTIIDSDCSIHGLRNRAIFYLAKYCALRVSEVSLLRLSDFDPYRRTIYCRRLKNSKNNTLKIVDNIVFNVLLNYYEARQKQSYPTDFLFPSQLGQGISRQMLDTIMKHYCRQTHISFDKQHFHVLKHTRAMELINYDDISLRDVQFWLGHRYIENTMIYLEYTSRAMNTLFCKLELQEGDTYNECSRTNQSQSRGNSKAAY